MSVVSVEILGVTLAGVGALGAICTAIIQRFPPHLLVRTPARRTAAQERLPILEQFSTAAF